MKLFTLFCFSFFLMSCDEELSANDQVLLTAFENKQSDLQVEGEGKVIVLLADDTTGSQHQKFILELESEQTILIAHNIDLAPRIDSIKKGDTVAFYGEYVWNDEGGLVHWTHIDPAGVHINGWLIHNGLTYE